MSGQQDGFLRQFQYTLCDTLHQCLLTPTGKMCQPETVPENGITHEGHIVLGAIIEYAVRSMTGNVVHGQRKYRIPFEGNPAPVRQIAHIIQFDI